MDTPKTSTHETTNLSPDQLADLRDKAAVRQQTAQRAVRYTLDRYDNVLIQRDIAEIQDPDTDREPAGRSH